MSRGDYLERLLKGVSVEWRSLGEVTLPTSNIRWRDTDRTYRYIDLTSVRIETKTIADTLEIAFGNAPSRAQKLVEKDDVIFATTRPTQQRYCLINDDYSGEVASTGYCVLRFAFCVPIRMMYCRDGYCTGLHLPTSMPTWKKIKMDRHIPQFQTQK